MLDNIRLIMLSLMYKVEGDNSTNKKKKGIYKMLKLKNSVKVFVPVTNNNGDKVDLSFETENALNVIGGATTFTASGNWIENGKLYTDNINVMQFNCNEFDKDTVHVINELIRAIFIKAEQLAVSVEVNGTLYILDSVNDIEDLF